MRHGRAKAARRTLQFLARTQNYKLPYNVLLDGTFCVAAMRMKVPIQDRILRLLQQHELEKVRLHVTQSTLDELKVLAEQPTKHQEYIQQACAWAAEHASVVPPMVASAVSNHKSVQQQELSPTAQDILTVLTLSNSDPKATKYFLASQDDQLLHEARCHSVPIIRLQRAVLLLEQPSHAAELADRGMERQKWKNAVPEHERELASFVRSEQKQRQQPTNPAGRQRVKKKAKGPNPLSCKRKKHASDEAPSSKRIKT